MASLNRSVGPDLLGFACRRLNVAPHLARLEVDSLLGGLVSSCVQGVRVRKADDPRDGLLLGFVVKELRGTASREAVIYERLAPHARGLGPALLGIERADDRAYLYLERVESEPNWPWSDTTLAELLLAKLAHFHACSFDWSPVDDGELDRELELAAATTLATACYFARVTGDARVRGGLPALRRLVADLPQLRRWLIDSGPLPTSVIHGDVHPGNVLIGKCDGRPDPLLVDWARTRRGSPLEDVSSFIQWLAFWEYNAMRRHDSLLRTYLRARGIHSPPSMAIRDAYWMAGAINSCSGALTYHLSIAMDPELPADQRETSTRAAHHCIRIIRRADRVQRDSPSLSGRRS